MNKIKIIDLINMISKGEEVPKKIKYNGEEFQFTGYDRASKNYINELEDLFEVLDGSMLNDKVEILDEEKKIPEKITMRAGLVGDINNKIENLDINIMAVEDKLNQLIDYLKSKGE